MTTGIETTIAIAIVARIAPAQAATAARGIGAGSATLATGLRTRSGPGSATMMRSGGAGRTSGGAGMSVITAPVLVARPVTITGVTTAAAATGATTTATMARVGLVTGAAATVA